MISQPPGLPALFRTSDIGVSSEWRDISYDWLPVLTKHGVAVYSYLRDTYDQQRNLRPFLVDPSGPTKRKMQNLLGLDTDYALQGPEYLLTTVGLVHVEVGYRQSSDPERPNHTHVAYYTVGRLDHPVLDWPMLQRVLEAVSFALQPVPRHKVDAVYHRKTDAALRVLGQAGFLQNCDPADLFYEYGAWPHLLPTLIQDERWLALFAHLHGSAEVARYRQQARVWVEYTQRTTARLTEQNQAISELILTAQGRGPRGGGSPSGGPGRSSSAGAEQFDRGSQITGTPAAKPIQLNQTGFVPGESQASPKPIQLNQTGSGTPPIGSHQEAIQLDPACVPDESQWRDQLTSRCCSENDFLTSKNTPSGDMGLSSNLEHVPHVAEHLRDAELTTTRIDNGFWCAVNYILLGNNDRYPYSAGERKAAQRQFQRANTPIGVVLAALRAMITLPEAQRPHSFAAALKMDLFHACVQQALGLIAPRADTHFDARDWSTFLRMYRTLGMAEGLRNVSPPDYHVLHNLFTNHPTDCWDVLSRIEHAAECPDLSPQYLRRAIRNNQQEAAQLALLPAAQTAHCRVANVRSDAEPSPERPLRDVNVDPRRALLMDVGLKPNLLQGNWTESYIRAWIDEADRREAVIKSRVGWLIWGLTSGYLPADHPKLPPYSGPAPRSEPSSGMVAAPVVSESPENDDVHRTTWAVILTALEQQLPRSEFDTWIKETRLLDLGNHKAVVGTSNIFAREKIEGRYVGALQDALAQYLGYQVQVHVVIGS